MPVSATTWKPSRESWSMAMLATPPVAPFTSTLPFAGASPFICMRSIASAAVWPATPSALASKRLMPFGSGITQSAGKRPYSA